MLIDLDNTLLAYLGAALQAKWPQVNIFSAAVGTVEGNSPVVHLMLRQVGEHPDLKGTGERVRRDETTKQSYHLPPPCWLLCKYYLAAAVPPASVGQAPFDGDSQRQMQLKLLHPLLARLMTYTGIPDTDLRGCFVDAPTANYIHHLNFNQLCHPDNSGLPVIEFSVTAAMTLSEEYALPKAVREVAMEPEHTDEKETAE